MPLLNRLGLAHQAARVVAIPVNRVRGPRQIERKESGGEEKAGRTGASGLSRLRVQHLERVARLRGSRTHGRGGSKIISSYNRSLAYSITALTCSRSSPSNHS